MSNERYVNNELVVYNSLSRKKELFKPIAPPYVGMYVCGPTVYSNVHLGNVRTFLSFDVIYRYLTYLGFRVRYVRNITDVGHLTGDTDHGEDKIAKKARLENLEPMEVVQRYTNDFHDVMRLFNILPPSIEPTATGHIIEQIEMIETIMKRGFAYEVDGSVYFDVRKFNDQYGYGKLSGRNIDDLISNTRDLDGQDRKRDSLDFALWKKADDTHLMHWPSPWSVGFPGWHLECSVMSTKYLGEEFDIHGGGMDLKFPHHECEIAQDIGANGKTPVHYWLHGNMLTVNNRKMAKSEGNGFTPEELLTGNHPLLDKGYSAETVRFFMLQGHYASTLDFSNAALQAAEKGFQKMVVALESLDSITPQEKSEFDLSTFEARCRAAMNDDFNTPILIAVLFDLVKVINSAASGKYALNTEDIQGIRQLFKDYFESVLGLKSPESSSLSGELTDELMELLLELRTDAKVNKDYAMADRIRDELLKRNVQIKDAKEGSTWIYEK